jgi:ATP-binding protein involved in chromosome partitioning
MAEGMGVNFLGEIALDPEVRIGGDTGKPVATRDGDPRGETFLHLARGVVDRLAAIGPQTGPRIDISE